jgi:hypothetical protein
MNEFELILHLSYLTWVVSFTQRPGHVQLIVWMLINNIDVLMLRMEPGSRPIHICSAITSMSFIFVEK